MTNYTYEFQVGYTKLGVATVPADAPTINVINVDTDALIITGAATTALANMPGVYRYSYTGSIGLNLTGLFHTSDTSMDQQDLFSIDINSQFEPAVVASGVTRLDNAYATIGEYKSYRVARGQTASADAADDIQIDLILNAASRWIDKYTARKYYPRMGIRYYDIPESRRLWFNDDLLSLTSLTNGDSTVVASTDYILEDYNVTPYYSLKLKSNVDTFWEVDTDSGHERVIQVSGTWGVHDDYARAWVAEGSLSTDVAIGATSFVLNAGHTVETGDIIKIDNEIMQGTISSSDTFTPTRRGDNGSSAAAHLENAIVYTWEPLAIIKDCCLQIATNYYQRRTGQQQMAATVTAMGVVLTPQDIPQGVTFVLDSFRKL